MYIPGHLSVAFLITRTAPGRAFAFAALGALTPDLIDKPLRLLGTTPYGRTLGHAILFWVLAWLLLTWWHVRTPAPSVWKRRYAWFLAGATSHLFVDLFNDLVAGFLYNAHLFSAWFAFPYLTPDDWGWKIARAWWPCTSCPTPLEGVVLVVALGVWLVSMLDRSRQPSYQEEMEE